MSDLGQSVRIKYIASLAFSITRHRPILERPLKPPRKASPVPRNTENQSNTRDTLPWAACIFHILGNKVLHKTRCAKDRGRSKDTFGNRFEVYGYDADDRV
jgi:hypothetical protein